MKSIIQNINKTLLEKLPLIWVTRAVWVLLIAGVVHVLFFIMGFNVFNNPKLLQQYYADEIYLHNGILLFSIVCSVLILVVWLIVLFRHNTFKNFYPTSTIQLFASFFIYVILFVASTSFYVSYTAGYTAYIKAKYPDAKMEKQVDIANLAAAFLTFDEENYTIGNRSYPPPFDTLYCETEEDDIDFSKPYLQRFNDEYQYYTVTTKLVSSPNGDGTIAVGENSIYEKYISDSVKLLGFRRAVVDISDKANAKLSYYNYSQPQINANTGARVYYDDRELDNYPQYQFRRNIRQIQMNKRVYDFLNKNDAGEFNSLFTSFLEISTQLEIETNLTTTAWLSLIDRDSFYVSHFIRTNKNDDKTVYRVPEEDYEEPNKKYDTSENSNKKAQFYEDGITDYYFDANAMTTSFNNISSIKYNHRWNLIIFFQCWLAFGLAVILFIFRTSGLPALLLSIISAIVLSIIVVLVLMGLRVRDDLALLYSIFAIGTTILIVPLFFFKQVKKQVQAIFINISMIGFVPYLLLIMGIIHLHQERYYRALLGDDYYKSKPDFIFDSFGDNWNYPLLLAGLIFIFFYMPVIKRWKALPEG